MRLRNITHIVKQAGVLHALQCTFIVSLLAVSLATADPGKAIVDVPRTTDDAVRAFWNRCQFEMSSPAAEDSFRVRHFGQDARVADLLVNLIATGEKTGTFTSPWIFAGDPDEEPVLGGYTVVTDFFANPKLLLRTTAVNTMRFDEISEAETLVDGPAVRTLDVWRRVHWAYFERKLAKLNRIPSPDMPVTVEEFEVVCVNDVIAGDP
jgi:uncharacterized protein YhfF